MLIFWHDRMQQWHISSQLFICMDSSSKGGHLWYYICFLKKTGKRKNKLADKLTKQAMFS